MARDDNARNRAASAPKRPRMKSTTAEKLVESETAPPEPRLASLRLRIVPDRSVESTSSIWAPVARTPRGIPTTDEVRQQTRAPQCLPAELEHAITAVLFRPLRADETHQAGNDNRERELRQLFARLSAVEALHLRRRLDCDRSDDELVAGFRRLVAERRARLRAFLADPRRQARP